MTNIDRMVQKNQDEHRKRQIKEAQEQIQKEISKCEAILSRSPELIEVVLKYLNLVLGVKGFVGVQQLTLEHLAFREGIRATTAHLESLYSKAVNQNQNKVIT